MSDFELPAHGWKPRADQLPVWNAAMSPNLRYLNIVGHRRFGKDELALQMLAVHAMAKPASWLFVWPEYEQIRKGLWEQVNWRTGRTRIDDVFPPEIVAKRDNETMALTLESGSQIQFGGSNRVDSLVGGGQAGIVISEAAISRPEAKMLLQPVIEESGGWIMEISTPRGKNHFYRSHTGAVQDMARGEPGVYGFYMPASKTGVFSAEQLRRIKMELVREHGVTVGAALFEQEYLCSWEAAVVGAVWGQELADMAAEGRIRPLRHDRRFPVHTSWDIGVGDATVILFWQSVNGEDRLIDGFEASGIGLDSYVRLLKERYQEHGYLYGTHHGPHDVQQREWVRGLSRKEEARRLGLEFKRTPQTRVKTQISAAAQLLRNVVVNMSSPGAMEALEHWRGYHYPKQAQNGVQSTLPVHDEHSHASSALMTYAVANAARLRVAVGDGPDPVLSPQGGATKFDPRVYDVNRSFQGSSINPWPVDANAPVRGAFG